MEKENKYQETGLFIKEFEKEESLLERGQSYI